jgi:cell division protease FtsH
VAVGLELAERHEVSDALAAAVDQEVTDILSEACHCARQILATQRRVMDRVVARLKEVETVSAGELDDIVATTNQIARPAS